MTSLHALQSKYGIHILSSDTPTFLEEAETYGLVTGNAIMGANFIKDFFARVADVTGGRVSGYEKAMNGALIEATEQMLIKASALGANTIICTHVDFCAVGPRMLMASCYGTACYLIKKPKVKEPQDSVKPTYLHPQPLG